eukprot:COSAG02_NODE_12603_length_1520_cov_2.269529_2_plen_100_part_00
MEDKPYLNNHLRFKILFHTEPQGVSHAVRSLASAAVCAVHLNAHMVVTDCFLNSPGYLGSRIVGFEVEAFRQGPFHRVVIPGYTPKLNNTPYFAALCAV